MNDWNTLEKILRARGLSSTDLKALRDRLGGMVVHTNSGVVANSISGPIAIGAGATAAMNTHLPKVEERVAEEPIAPAEKAPVAPDGAPPATAKGDFWRRADEIAKTASSATAAVGKILEIATKFF